ncbi:hypothetical protein AX17_003899 [Amanita inopinata Kibby_2008]|nr:hypothetical protein AX17_003899 [Amanita inopinata Kibby_2008]
MTSSRPPLTITPLKYADIPSEETILAEGHSLINSTSSWKQGKTYHKKVRTYHRTKGPGDGAPWYCRVSEHTPDEATFDQLWDKLGRNKATNEEQYIPDIRKVTKVKALSDNAEIWSLYYTFTPPVSPRVFTVLQVAHLNDSSPRTGLIVSVPVDLVSQEDLAKLEEKGVKGRYVSVERLMELENGSTEWRMATSSNPGGLIPSFVAESTMPGAIVQDVPHFFKWFHSLPK